MLKRLIEVTLPLKEVSEQSAKESRDGHISTLHIWWARRPLAACRAVVFASLIPDPDDPECPQSFKSLVNDLLKENEFKPRNGDGSSTKDTPRNRCLEFIKQLVKWENSNNPHYIEPARKLIAAAHKILHPDSPSEAPHVLDPFAGGGAIPLEALRLGCEAHAIDLNPVAHLIELCTLVYPQMYGQPNSRPVPDYIRRLIAHIKAKKRAEGGAGLFDRHEDGDDSTNDDLIPNVEITEAEYLKNPLAADVKYWGNWVWTAVKAQIGNCFPPNDDGRIPIAFLWAKTVECPNPTCHLTVPLIQQLWLCKKPKRRIALRLKCEPKNKKCVFEVVQGPDIDFDPKIATIRVGKAQCPSCSTVIGNDQLRQLGLANRMSRQLMAVVTIDPRQKGKVYRTATERDIQSFNDSVAVLDLLKAHAGDSLVPTEQITPDRPSPNSRGLSAVVRDGTNQFGLLFNERQLLTLATYCGAILQALEQMRDEGIEHERSEAVGSFLALALSSSSNFLSTICRWQNNWEVVTATFSRQALPMVWDYAELNGVTSGEGWPKILGWMSDVIRKLFLQPAVVKRGSAQQVPFQDKSMDTVITDPPYYDAVPYADLSDFFYVWLKRATGTLHGDLFRTPLTPKAQELIAYFGSGKRKVQKTNEWYESGMSSAFREMFRSLRAKGVCCVMFAHKTTAAWEALIGGLTACPEILCPFLPTPYGPIATN